MMKKRIMMAVLLLSLLGCGTIDKNKQPALGSNEALPKIPEYPDTPEISNTPKGVEENHKEDGSESSDLPDTQDRILFIKSIFNKYGYNAPDVSKWKIEEQGPHKIAVIIKQHIPKGRPLITKLIFNQSANNEIYFLQIENKIIIK